MMLISQRQNFKLVCFPYLVLMKHMELEIFIAGWGRDLFRRLGYLDSTRPTTMASSEV